jgi:outer membrane protein TolC
MNFLLRMSLAAVFLAAAACSGNPKDETGADAVLPELPPDAKGAPAPEPEPMGPLSLDRAIELALERNPDMRAASERIGMAKARIFEAASSFWPHVGARLTYLRTNNPAHAFGMILAQRSFTPSLNFNDPPNSDTYRPESFGSLSLYRGGQDHHAVQAAKRGTEAASHQRSAIRNALAEAVTSAFYAILATREQVEVAEASIQAVESEHGEARKRFEAGALLKSDVLSLEVRLAAAREGRVRARNAVELARAGLRMLLALDAQEKLEIDPKPPTPAPPEARTYEAAAKQALANRPEIHAAEALTRLRRSQLEMFRGEFGPRVNAFASYGGDFEEWEPTRDQDHWMLGISVELDLFSGFGSLSRVNAAERRLGEARALQEKVQRQIEREVREATLSLKAAEERVRVTEASVTAAEEALRLVREQYQAGTATVTRYLEAEAALADARSRSIASRLDRGRAEAGIKRATGFWK